MLHGALKRGSGDAHALGGLGLGQAFQVGQAQRLQLLGQQAHLPQVMQRYAGRLKDRLPARPGEDAALAWAWHGNGVGLLLSVAALTATAPSASWLMRLVLLTARQVDDLRAGFLGDLFQFGPAEEGALELDIGTLHGDDGKAGATRALADVPALSHKDLAH
jgi:hypothetical protein